MAKLPTDDPKPARRQPDTKRVIKPEGKFKRETDKPRLVTDRSPRSVTAIRPQDMEPILPEMPYIPPA